MKITLKNVILIGLAAPLALTVLVFSVFYVFLGSRIAGYAELWIYFVGFFVFCGLFAVGLQFLIDRVLLKNQDQALSDWEQTRQQGKWNYVFSIGWRSSSMIVVCLAIVYFAKDRSEANDELQPLIAMGLSAAIIILGSFAVPLAFWNRREDELRARSKLSEDPEK